MVSEMFRKAVRLGPEWCPDTVGMLSDMRRNSRFKEWSDAGIPARVRLDSAVRMNRWNREMETLMAQKRLTMRQIHEILRLKYQNQLSVREIARSCGLAVSTVGDYVQRAAAARSRKPHSLASIPLPWSTPLPIPRFHHERRSAQMSGPRLLPGPNLPLISANQR